MIPHQGCHPVVIEDVIFDSGDLGTCTVGSHVLMIPQTGQFYCHVRNFGLFPRPIQTHIMVSHCFQPTRSGNSQLKHALDIPD